jgi:hypothetical protein
MSVALISGFSTLPRPVRRLEASSKGASGPPRGQGRDSAPRRPPAPTNSLALCAVGRDEWLKHPFARLFKRRRAWVETRVRRCRGGLAASGWRKGGPNCESPAISPSNHSRSSFHPALSGDRAVRRTMGEGATEYRQSQQLPLSSRANATTARILCCDPDHSTLGNNVLGFVLVGGGCRIVQCHLGHLMNWQRAAAAFAFAIYLGSSAAVGGMLPRVEALGNPAVHKVQRWVKPFLHDSIGHDPYHVGMPADLLRRDQQSGLVPLDQQVRDGHVRQCGVIFGCS